MKMQGKVTIPATQEKVWAALNDPAILKACIPGCEVIEQLSPTELRATVRAKVGPVSASFKGQVTMSDLDPPNGYRISGEGTGGAAGFAKGGATVSLVAEGHDTILSYEVDANVGGKLAQIGQRLIDGTAKKMADEFFQAFASTVGGPPAQDAEADSHGADAHGGAHSTGSEGLPTAAWLGGIIVLVASLVVYFLSR
jgi:carbon monoxide dehydrogenase subunit G